MCALLRKDSALARRIKSIEKEISVINRDVKSLSKVVKRAEGQISQSISQQDSRMDEAPERVAVREEIRAPAPVPVVKPPAPEPEPSVPLEPAGKKPDSRYAGNRDTITRDGRFATYLMSRDFHDVRPLRHEKHVQRNKAVFMVVIFVIVLLWMVLRFF